MEFEFARNKQAKQHPCKESNVSCFDDTVTFSLFQKGIASRVYIFSSRERILLKELFFPLVILDDFGPPKASALDENVYV